MVGMREEQLRRRTETIQALLQEGEWLTATGKVNVAPKDALDAPNESGAGNADAELVAAAAKRLSSYVA